MLLGGIIILSSVLAYVWSSNHLADFQTLTGHLARSLSRDIAQNYQGWQAIQFVSMGAGVAGLVLLIYGVAARDPIDTMQWQHR